MADINTEIVEFLQVFIKDIKYLVERQELIINRPMNVIAVWEELNKTITSIINHIATISSEELTAKLNETGLSITQIEWEENKTYLVIGNEAAHGDYDDYDLRQIEKFYQHIQTLLNSYNV